MVEVEADGCNRHAKKAANGSRNARQYNGVGGEVDKEVTAMAEAGFSVACGVLRK